MTKLRKFLYGFAVFITFLCLMQLPYSFAVSSILSSPDSIDQALEEGGVYDNAISLALDDVAKKNNDPNAQRLLADQGFKDAITSSVTPDDVQTAARSAFGGIFAWLQGKTSLPEFKIDLTEPAGRAVEKLGVYAEQRASNLPTCTIAQLQTINLQDNLLSLPCLPPGISASQVGQQFANQAKQDIDLLKDPIIDSEELFKEADTAQLQNGQVPAAYQASQNSKWVALALTLIFVSLLIFARRDRLAGVRVVGITLLVAAVLLGTTLLFARSAESFAVVSDDKAGEIALNTILSLINQIMDSIRWFALAYAVLGAVALVAVHKLKPKDPSVPTAQTPKQDIGQPPEPTQTTNK